MREKIVELTPYLFQLADILTLEGTSASQRAVQGLTVDNSGL
jgi:hypothetical protein